MAPKLEGANCMNVMDDDQRQATLENAIVPGR
jgi:hypothetical protein